MRYKQCLWIIPLHNDLYEVTKYTTWEVFKNFFCWQYPQCNDSFLQKLHIWGINNTFMNNQLVKKVQFVLENCWSFTLSQIKRANAIVVRLKRQNPNKWLPLATVAVLSLITHLRFSGPKYCFCFHSFIKYYPDARILFLFSLLYQILSRYLSVFSHRDEVSSSPHAISYFEVQHNFPKTYFIMFLNDKPLLPKAKINDRHIWLSNCQIW